MGARTPEPEQSTVQGSPFLVFPLHFTNLRKLLVRFGSNRDEFSRFTNRKLRGTTRFFQEMLLRPLFQQDYAIG